MVMKQDMADLHFCGLVWINISFIHCVYADKCMQAPIYSFVTPRLPLVSLNQAVRDKAKLQQLLKISRNITRTS